MGIGTAQKGIDFFLTVSFFVKNDFLKIKKVGISNFQYL